jgi:hypothetical protein
MWPHHLCLLRYGLLSAPWNPDRPFHIDPDAVQWRRHGALVHVTNLLLALPADDLTTEPT